MINGFNYWTAGYDYNTVNANIGFQGNFLDNGIVTPDRAWTGKLTEVKKVYANVTFEFDKSSNRLTIRNKNNFINLDRYQLIYQITRDGLLAEEGRVNLPAVSAGSTGTVTVGYSTAVTSDAEYLILFQLRLKESTLWAPAGYVVSENQFALNDRPALDTHAASGGSLSLSGNTVSGTTAEGKRFSISFGTNGKMTSWTFDGKSILTTGPDFNSMRDIDNDRGLDAAMVSSSSTSFSAGLQRSGSNYTATVSGSATNCSYTNVYTIYPDGTVDMKVTFSPKAETRRIGLGMTFASGLENVTYYGRGPWSNYVDRMSGSFLGRYATTVDDMLEEQIHPQTNGDRTGLRELTLLNANNGLYVTVKASDCAISDNTKVNAGVAFSLSHYDESRWCDTGDTMWSDKLHWYDLTRNDGVFAHFDAYQRGLGNNSCAGDQALSKHRCPTSGTLSYTLRFMPGVK